jgi:Xaa-Pro aminopeptidase
LLSDPRFDQQIGEECPGLATWIRQPGDQMWNVVCQQLSQRGLDRLVIESSHLSVDAFDQLCEQSGVSEIKKGTVQVEQLRVVKDADEIQLIRTAIRTAERVFASIRAQWDPRLTERDVADEIERLCRKLGGEGCSFPPIVAVGPRAALPHATPGQSLIGSSNFVLIDWGCRRDGYCSDLTRVLMNSTIPPKFSGVYETVLAAQRAAIESIKPGVLASEVDRVAREVIEGAGMGEQFTHGLGHGMGLDIHEAPRLGRNQEIPLQPGMVITVEPGIYFPQWGGVRIEDDVLVTDLGCEVLSTLPADLQSNCVEEITWNCD